MGTPTDIIEPDVTQPANAYQAYQLARYHFHRISFSDVMKSRAWLEEAIRLDDKFAPAYAGLAEQALMEALTGLRAPADSFPKAKEALRRAADLKLESAEFYAVAGFTSFICDWNFHDAETQLHRALKLNPHHTFAYKYLGEALMFQGRPVEAENYLKRALEIEPMNLHVGMILTLSYFLARNYERLIEECERLLAMHPRFFVAATYRCLAWEQLGRVNEAITEYERITREPDGEIARRFMGYAYALAGDRKSALQTIEKLEIEGRQHYLSLTFQANVYAALNETERAFSCLEQALWDRDPWLLLTGTDPRLDTLRQNSQFNKLLLEVGLGHLTQSQTRDTFSTKVSVLSTERWQQIETLFHEALAYECAKRKQFLVTACADDNALRHEVESLLSSLEEADDFIETPAGDVAAEMLGAQRAHFEPGQEIENYRIVRQLGSGGMGEVYLAEDIRLKRNVALKLLPPHFTVNPDRVRRFEREARAASALNHPNIVTIYDIGQSNTTHFIATEFVDGKTLRQLINEKPFTLNETLNVSMQIADALSGAHAAGIVHRDIKPENIMIRRDGYVKILDFGLAKLTEQQTIDSDLETPTLLQSNPGLVMGTVQYMSPEQARAKNVGVSTDIWSLGIVMYELLAGHVPFTGETPSHVMVSLMEDRLPALKERAHVPEELDRIVTKALQKSQKERYRTARELARVLKNLKQKLQRDSALNQWLKTIPSQRDGARLSPLPAAAVSGAHKVRLENRTAETTPVESHFTSSADSLVRKVRSNKLLAVFATLFILMGVVVLTYLLTKQGPRNLPASDKKTIAVLPLTSVDKTKRDEIYEIGIADSLIHRLSAISRLTVRPLSATRKYADIEYDPISAGKEQHVDYVVASNYQLADGRIHVVSQLLNVATGQIEETYQAEKDAAAVFGTDAIAVEIGNLLLNRFEATTNRPEVKRGTTNEEAYRLYLQAMYLYGKRTERASKQAVELLDQAVNLDPNYARAWAGKAHAHRYVANLGRDTDIHAEYRKSMEAINRALSLDNNLSEAYSALCENKYYYEFDFAGAETACKRAIALDPNSSLAHEIYGRYLYHHGRFTEGITELETAIDLEPTSLFNQRNLGIALYYAGQYEKSKAQFKRTIAMDESFASAYSWLRNILELEGNYAEAFDWFIKAQRIVGTDEETIRQYETIHQKSGYQAVLRAYVERFDKSINQYYVGALLYADIGNKDKAFEYLDIAYQRREWGINSLLVEPRLNALRGDPRFSELVKKVGL